MALLRRTPRGRRTPILLAIILVTTCYTYWYWGGSEAYTVPLNSQPRKRPHSARLRPLNNPDSHEEPIESPYRVTNLDSKVGESYEGTDLFQGEAHKASKYELEYANDGCVHGWAGPLDSVKRSGTEAEDQHPIHELMDHGRRRWSTLLTHVRHSEAQMQSKTLSQAVTSYRTRYGRDPPEGFDNWYKFARDHNVKIIDNYDQIDREISSWLAIRPQVFRQRVTNLFDAENSVIITLAPDKPATITSSTKGDAATHSRAIKLLDLLGSLAQFLPHEVTIVVSDHDSSNWVLPGSFKQAIQEAISQDRYLTDAELVQLEEQQDKLGIIQGCDEDEPARQLVSHIKDRKPTRLEIATAVHSAWKPEERNKEATFVYDVKPGMDFCLSPELLTIHGSFSWHYKRNHKLRPLFWLSKPAKDVGQFGMVPLEAYYNATSEIGISHTSTWEEKTIPKLFWRGSNTGDHYGPPGDFRELYDWRNSHRFRLHNLANAEEGDREIWVRRKGGWFREEWDVKTLNDKYFDIGLAGNIHQCDPETCEEIRGEVVLKGKVNPSEAKQYQYVLDIDGNGWSSRFHRLLGSGSVVLKQTVYPEWNSDWLTPWVHYVPVQHDNSDLYNIMSFFAGAPDSDGADHYGHEKLAKEISDNARSFAEEFWRWEDMQAYMLRFLLEYARLAQDDRKAASYQG